MQNKLTSKRTTKREISEYRQHKKNIKRENVRPKVDNKAPLLDIIAYYNTSDMQNKAAILSQIEEENIKLIQRINIIYRTHGLTDSSKPKSLDQRVKKMDSIVNKNRKLYKENLQLLSNLIYAKPQINFKEMEKDQKKHTDMLILMSKYPECYKKKSKNKENEYDPLVAHKGLLKHIRIRKSKCYLDVKDVTADKHLGRLMIELYDAVVPKTAENFLTLCKRREDVFSYKGKQFFRIIPGAFCVCGDVEHSHGLGEVSAFAGERYFQEENFALSHSVPGVLSMYKNNENASQFLITFKPLKVLDGKYVAFGRVISGFDTLKLMEDNGFPSGKPKHKIIIEECGEISKIW